MAVEHVADYRTWRIHLDRSLRWSDGTTLTAHDAVRSIARVGERPRSAVYAGFFDANDDGFPVRVLDDACLEYRFTKPVSYAAAFFSIPQLAPSHPVGTARGGPVLGSYAVESSADPSIRLVRQAFAPDTGGPRSLEFQVYPSLGDALTAFDEGRVDISPTTGFGPDELDRYLNHRNRVSRDVSIFGSLEVGAGAPHLEAPDLRRALGFALDRAALARSCPGLVSGFLGTFHQPAPALALSAGEVNALRSALGPEPEIPYADFSPNGQVVAAVCEQLNAVLGISATPTAVSYRRYVNLVLSREYTLLYTLTTPEFGHPGALLLPWHSTHPNARRLRFSDSAFDELVDAASATADGEADETWRRAEERWLELMPRVPLIQVSAHCVHSDRLSGVRLSPDGLFDFDRLAVSRTASASDGFPECEETVR